MKPIYLLLAPLLLSAETQLSDIDINSSQTEATDFLIQKESFLKNAPMQQQITTKQALQIAGTNGDPLKALKSFAGVVSTNNDGGDDIFIHGSKPRETSYSINQLPLGYIFHAGGLHSVIAPESTAQIDAYLGAFDTTYDAMGAVVDITPKFPKGSNSGRVHLGFYDADFSLDTKLGENTSLFLSGRRSYFDLFVSKIVETLDEDERDRSKKVTFTLFPQYYDANMILAHTKGNHTFSLEAITAKDEQKLNSTMNQTKDPVANGKINSEESFTTLGLRWNYEGKNFDSMTLLSQIKAKEHIELFDANHFVNIKTTSNKLYHETTFETDGHKPLIGFDIKETTVPLKAHVAGDVGDDDFEPLITDQAVVDIDKRLNAKEYALFVQDIWEITKRDHLRYGVRVWDTDFQEFGSGIDPRVAYTHEFKDGWSTAFAMGKYSQLPKVSYAVEGFGNPQLNTTEFSNHYALNLTKKFGNHSSLVVEPYFKTFKNLAISDEVNSYKGVGEGEAYGLDVTYKKKLDKFEMMVAYTFVKAKRQLHTNSSTEYRFQGDIPHTLQVNSSYKFDNNWRVASLFKYNSGRPYTPIVGTQNATTASGRSYNRPIYGEAYSKRMPSNFDLDIQVGKTYHYANSSLEVAFELMNLNALFHKNVDAYRYDDNYQVDGEYRQMGFLPALHLSYKF